VKNTFNNYFKTGIEVRCVAVEYSDYSAVDWTVYFKNTGTKNTSILKDLWDYYPLTPYSLQLNQWMAWQLDRPEQGDGLVQPFRRDKCDEPVKTFSLRGLNPAAQYEVTNFDVEGTTRISGKELMEKGLTVEIKDNPGSALITYKLSK
jgi:hypothetical protein